MGNISKNTTSKKKISKSETEIKKNDDFGKLLAKSFITDQTPDSPFVAKGQYKEALELLEDAEACQLTPMLIGPPGTGKAMLARSFASSRERF